MNPDFNEAQYSGSSIVSGYTEMTEYSNTESVYSITDHDAETVLNGSTHH